MVRVESNTCAVVTPVQSISRQWHPGSEYTAIVNKASLSTLALFTAILHHRLQWSMRTMKTPHHIHRSGVIPGLWHLHRVLDALTAPSGFGIYSHWILHVFVGVVYVYLVSEQFVFDNQSRDSSLEEARCPLPLSHWYVYWHCWHQMDSVGCRSISVHLSVINLRGNHGVREELDGEHMGGVRRREGKREVTIIF